MWFAIGKFIVILIFTAFISVLISPVIEAIGLLNPADKDSVEGLNILVFIILIYIGYFSKSAKRARFERKLKKDKREAPYKIRRCSWCGNSFKMRDSGYEWHCSKRCCRQDN